MTTWVAWLNFTSLLTPPSNPDSQMHRVLVTGASGLIGGLVVKHLGHKYNMSALNRRPVEGVPCTRADIADLEAILPAFEGVDMVVHMANYLDDMNDWEQHLAAGIIGTRNVFEAARLGGVKRVVYGSTGDTQTGYEYDEDLPYGALAAGKYDQAPKEWPMINYRDPVRPKNLYGTCKVFGEALGSQYADLYELSVLCIRLGAVLPEDRPLTRRQLVSYLSHADCISVVDKCLELPLTHRYDIFRATSHSRYRWMDFEHTREVLGWEPQSTADDFEVDDAGGWHQVLPDYVERRKLKQRRDADS